MDRIKNEGVTIQVSAFPSVRTVGGTPLARSFIGLADVRLNSYTKENSRLFSFCFSSVLSLRVLCGLNPFVFVRAIRGFKTTQELQAAPVNSTLP